MKLNVKHRPVVPLDGITIISSTGGGGLKTASMIIIIDKSLSNQVGSQLSQNPEIIKVSILKECMYTCNLFQHLQQQMTQLRIVKWKQGY